MYTLVVSTTLSCVKLKMSILLAEVSKVAAAMKNYIVPVLSGIFCLWF